MKSCPLGSIRIGCTKILETIWMVESQKMVSGKLGEKIVCLFIQRYIALCGKFGRKFVSNLSVDIDGIRDRKCNYKRVIFFSPSPKVFARKSSFDLTAGIVVNLTISWTTCTLWLRDTRGKLARPKARINIIVSFWTSSQKENYARQLDLSVHGKQGYFCNPKSWHRIKWALLTKPWHLSWREIIYKKIPPPVLRWRHTIKILFLFLVNSRRMRSNWSQENFRGVLALQVWNRKIYRGGFLKCGEDRKRHQTSAETFVDCLANKSPP